MPELSDEKYAELVTEMERDSAEYEAAYQRLIDEEGLSLDEADERLADLARQQSQRFLAHFVPAASVPADPPTPLAQPPPV